MQEVVFANVNGEILLLLARSGKYCDYLKLKKSGSLGTHTAARDWTSIVGIHLEGNPEKVLALKQGKTIIV